MSLLSAQRRSSAVFATSLSLARRQLSTATRPRVKIVEVGPRDGLQNEPSLLSVDLKKTLIDKLVRSGLRTIEAGSFVSPKWVPRMAGTKEVMLSPEVRQLRREFGSDLELPVLVPNLRGLADVKQTITEDVDKVVDEVAVFIAATESFSKANLNCTIAECLDRFAPVVEGARKLGLRARGYVSVAVGCPFEGRVDETVVEDLTKKLIEMGCYEVSVADTIGTATLATMEQVFNAVTRSTPIGKLAVCSVFLAAGCCLLTAF
jgi:hydroxymethylglutaryl-CoA lyase